MPTDASGLSKAIATPAWLRVERVLSGDGFRGVGVGTWGGGTKVAIRWAPDPRVSGLEARSATSPEVEYSALTSIPSRGTPEPLDLLAWSGRVFSVTRWIPAPRNMRLSRAMVEGLATQLWDILGISHEAGWVHGDIRPENIVVDRRGDAHLVDWEGACRPGTKCSAGPLGYAPYWAWTGSYVADPANDYYSLAIVLWEAWNRRTAFKGDRAAIIQLQSSFAFECDTRPPSVVEALFDAARERRAARARPNAPRRDGRGAVDPARVLRTLIRRRLSSAASTAIATIGDGGVLLVNVPGLKPHDERFVVAAMLDELRARWSRSCIALDTAAAYAKHSLQPRGRPGLAPLSRSDHLRGRRLRSNAEATAIGDLARSSVVVCGASSRLATVVRVEVAQCDLRLAASSDVAVSPPLVDSRVELDADLRREWLLETARVTLATTSVMGASKLAIEHRTPPGLREITKLVDAAVETEAMGQSPTHRSSKQRRAGNRRDMRSGPQISSRRTHSNRALAIQRLLSAGENAAASGRSHDVFRCCVRAHSELIGSWRPSAPNLLRLADLWLECARGDAAEIVLRMIRSPARRTAVAVRLGRVLSSRNDVDGIRAHVERAQSLPLNRELAPELYRLRAIIAMHEGDRRSALALGMQAMRCARQSSEDSGVWAAITTGNVLRSLGRTASARRLLKIARRRSTAIGSVRLSVVAGGNLLQVLQVGEAPGKAAQDAAELAVECRNWGMISESATLIGTAAALAIIGHEPKRAVQLIEQFWSEQGPRGYVKPAVSQLLARRWRDAVDLAESWPEIERLAQSEYAPGDSSASLHRSVLRSELGLDRWDSEGSDASATLLERGPVCQAIIDVLRSVMNPDAFTSAILALVDDIAAESPVVGHLARIIVQVELAHGRIDRLVALVRLQDLEDPSTASLVEATRILVACYGPPDVVAIARHHAPIGRSVHEWARPPGVRRWEWQTWRSHLAHAGAVDATDACSVAGAIMLAEDALAGLSQEVRRLYCRMLPYEAWRRYAGLGEIELPDLEAFDHATAPVTLFRAWLDRNGASGVREHARMVGLERVVQNALRLRATADVDTVLRQVALGVLEVGRAERAVVIYDQTAGPGIAVVATGGHVSYERVSAAEVSSSAIERVRITGHACIVDDACGDGDLGSKPSVRQYRARSLVIAPLRVRGRSLGYIYLENRSTARSFSASDAEIIEGFAAQAALALENAQLVSELRETCDTLQAARSDAVRQESLRMIGRAASEVAHDINNLLTAVLGETQLLLQSHVRADVRRSLEIIERAVLDGTAIVGRIQSSTRSHIQKSEAGVRVRQLALEVTEAIRRTAGARGIAIEAALGPSDMTVRGVAAELREVLTNVVMNAVDASSAGGVVTMAMDRSAERVEIRVEDCGCGMSSETVARAFEPFFSTKGVEGNGLGLSIAKGIVERHGGSIQIASAVGRGTTVTISLPIVLRDVPAGAAGDRAAMSLPVLVVSHDERVARSVLGSLSSLGVQSELVDTSAAALVRLRAEAGSIRAIVADLALPNDGAVGLARAAAEALGATNVVVLAGTTEGAHLQSAIQSLGVRLLRTPCSRAELARAVAAS